MVSDISLHRRGRLLGLIYLGLNILISVGAQFVLKSAMNDFNQLTVEPGLIPSMFAFFNIKVIFGMVLYALGTILWLLCLTKLDLSFAYPISTMQYLLIFVGAWYFFDETISILRIIGLLVICAGVIVMALDLKKK